MDNKTAELIALYIEEANEHLQMMEEDLLTIKDGGFAPELIDNIYRGAHSIKGAAGFFHFETIIKLSHAIEETLSLAREGLVLEGIVLDCLFECVDVLYELFKDVHSSNDYDVQESIQRMKQATGGETVTDQSPSEATEQLDYTPSTFDLIQFTDKLSSLANGGYLVFSLSIRPATDLIVIDTDCKEFLALLESLGEIVATTPQKDKILTHKKWQPEEQFDILFATVMEAELVSHASEIPLEKVISIDCTQFKRKIKLPVNKKTKHTDQTDAKAMPATKENIVTKTASPEATTASPEAKTAPPEAETAPPEAKATPPETNKPITVMRDETLRVRVSQLNLLVNMAGELVLGRNQLLRAAENLQKKVPGLGTIVKRLGIVISDLQEQIMNTRMQPISTVFGKFPRVIRDLEKTVGKKIELTQEGNEIELDKSIIESLADPLTHLVRNVADHGLELENERIKIGKSAHGHILLKAFHESGHVVVEISDDGRGIDTEKVALKALEKEIISRQAMETMSEYEKIQLIFSPGFSTKETASALSGRGVGMDVVKTNIEKLGGNVDVQSTLGKGTTVRMTLPLTLAIVSSLIFRLQKLSFIIPQINISEMVSIEPSEINNKIGWVQNRNVLKLRGRLMPLVRLSEILGCPDRFTNLIPQATASVSLVKLYQQAEFQGSIRIVVVCIGGNELGLVVDEISGIEEIVVKPMPEYMKNLNWYSGCTILGSGQVALIIDVLEVMKQQQISLSDTNTNNKIDSESNKEGKSIYLLTFSNGTEERFAIPIPDILRIDYYEQQKIQRIGQQEFIEHQGRIMHLIRLEQYLNIQKPNAELVAGNACLIILKNSEPPYCIYAHQILDSKYVRVQIEKNNRHGMSVAGNVLIDNKLHLLLDKSGLINSLSPKKIEKQHYDKNS